MADKPKSGTANKTIFVGLVVVLIVSCVSIGFVGYSNTNNLQAKYDKLETDYLSLNSSYIQLQSAYDNSLTQIGAQASNISQLESQVSSLNQQIASLNQQLNASQNTVQSQTATITNQTSIITSLQSLYSTLYHNITSLQTQLSNATTLIALLQGPSGILPTYMDLGNVQTSLSNGYYDLQLSLKNTGPLPITQIFITLNSVQITMPFTYLNTTVSSNTPLPSYQTATGNQNVTPPIGYPGTYPMIIQALATNGTIYTYQTTIASHV